MCHTRIVVDASQFKRYVKLSFQSNHARAQTARIVFLALGAKQPQTIPTLEPCLDPELWNKRVLLDQHPSTQDDPRDCRSPLLSLEPPGPIQTNLNVRLSVCPALLGRSSVPTMQQQSQAGEQMPEMVHAKGP